MATTRYEFLDIAKGLGILAVVWAHIMLCGWSHKLCYAFHMPLFFLMSGMLFQKNKYKTFGEFIRKRAKRLFVPYLLYSLATWVLWAVFRLVRGDAVASYWMPLLQTFVAQGSGTYLVHNSALWFIPCLFAVEVMYFFVGRLKAGFALLVSFALAGLSFVLGHLFGKTWWFMPPWNFDAAFIALPFYCVGNVLATRFPLEKMVSCVHSHKWGTFGLWVLLTVLLVFGAMKFGTCSMGSSLYNCSGWIFVLRAFVGCGAMLCFSLLLSVILKGCSVYQKAMDCIKWLGQNSLDVMCTHIPIKGVFVILVAALWHVSQDAVSSTMSLSLVVFAATMLVVVLVVFFVNYFFRNKLSKCRR
jgi:fucose 4-O-acetylase-like acetyltransferase